MFSIIIPLYNGEAYIKKTIESVQNQSIQDFEIVIVDDSSNDNSFQIVSSLAENDKRIRIVKNSSNMGFCKSVNKGVSLSKGANIITLGQDDLLDKFHMEKMNKILLDKSIVACYCNKALIDEKDHITSKVIIEKNELITKDFIKSNALYSCGLVIKKSAFNLVKGYPEFEKYPQYGEWYLWIKLSNVGRIVKCDNLFSFYRRHSNNLTNTFIEKEKRKKLEKYWNKCRWLAVRSKNCKISDKLFGIAYILYRKVCCLRLFI